MSEVNLRQRIIDVATELFAEQGYSVTSVRQVVEACACTKPALYYYFENKETLFAEIVGIHAKACDAMIEALAEQAGPAREAIHQVLEAIVNWATNNPAAMRLLQRVDTQQEDGAPTTCVTCARDMHIKAIRDQLQGGQQRGEIRGDVDAFECVLIIAGTVSLQFEMHVADDSWDRDRLHRTIDMIFDGIAA